MLHASVCVAMVRIKRRTAITIYLKTPHAHRRARAKAETDADQSGGCPILVVQFLELIENNRLIRILMCTKMVFSYYCHVINRFTMKMPLNRYGVPYLTFIMKMVSGEHF